MRGDGRATDELELYRELGRGGGAVELGEQRGCLLRRSVEVLRLGERRRFWFRPRDIADDVIAITIVQMSSSSSCAS